MKYPRSIQNLIDQFMHLPTVGPKTAERYVFYLLKKNPEDLKRFADALAGLKDAAMTCSRCFTISESNPCPVCSDEKRNRTQLCIVADSRDMASIEATRQYSGLYHVLNGELNAIEGIKPDQLTIKPLLSRLQNEKTTEVILALDPTIEGETTSLYLAKLLKTPLFQHIKVTRLAKGLPMGADLEYADEATLANALKYRNEMN